MFESKANIKWHFLSLLCAVCHIEKVASVQRATWMIDPPNKTTNERKPWQQRTRNISVSISRDKQNNWRSTSLQVQLLQNHRTLSADTQLSLMLRQFREVMGGFSLGKIWWCGVVRSGICEGEVILWAANEALAGKVPVFIRISQHLASPCVTGSAWTCVSCRRGVKLWSIKKIYTICVRGSLTRQTFCRCASENHRCNVTLPQLCYVYTSVQNLYPDVHNKAQRWSFVKTDQNSCSLILALAAIRLQLT